LIGGVTGLLVARVTLGVLVDRLPQTMPRLAAIGLDGTALAVGTAITLLLGVAMGLVPAVREARGPLARALRGGRRLPGGRHLARAGPAVTEVALAPMLPVGACLLARSLVQPLSVDPGFD